MTNLVNLIFFFFYQFYIMIHDRCCFILTGSPRGPRGPTTPLGPGSPGSPYKGRDTENETQKENVKTLN